MTDDARPRGLRLAWLALCWCAVAPLACDDASAPDPSGGAGTGGSPGGQAGSGGATSCEAPRDALIEFLEGNKECAVDEDCETRQVGCDISEDGCTGAVYVQRTVDQERFIELRTAWEACVNDGLACAMCERLAPPPACVAGRCQPRVGSSRLWCSQCAEDGGECMELSDCGRCPPTQQALPEKACSEAGLRCVYGPACGAKTCTCVSTADGESLWDCYVNAC